MVGSVDEAEDLVQETYVRAWRSFDRFEGRSSVRTWLYRIATNTCLTALQGRSRRLLPSGLGAANPDPDAPQGGPAEGVAWLQPFPDALAQPDTDDPASIVAFRRSVRLALVATLQYLPPRQRSVLLLREVLGMSAPEIADVLDTTTVAVKSTLQRARARMDQVAPDLDQVHEPEEPAVQELLDRYIHAFQAGDAADLTELLRDDTTIEAPPFAKWVEGRAHCGRYLENLLVAPDQYRMVPTVANGQPAAVAYRRHNDGSYRAFGVTVLSATSTGIAQIIAFCHPDLVARFGYPDVHPDSATIHS
jgi:RNA polymerase sigma-70 factor (ECF subfamily)